jgi:hypothetical protein
MRGLTITRRSASMPGLAKFFVALVSLLLAFLGSIAYTNLRLAYHRSRRNVTMAEMRTVATSLEARATDLLWFPAPQAESFETMRPVPFHELERALVPVYARRLPRVDGWDNPLEVRVGGHDPKTRTQHYAVRSVGNDARAESPEFNRGFITTFSEDIVFSDGSWIRAPEGM